MALSHGQGHPLVRLAKWSVLKRSFLNSVKKKNNCHTFIFFIHYRLQVRALLWPSGYSPPLCYQRDEGRLTKQLGHQVMSVLSFHFIVKHVHLSATSVSNNKTTEKLRCNVSYYWLTFAGRRPCTTDRSPPSERPRWRFSTSSS